MAAELEHYNFYRALGIDAEADIEAIREAHERKITELNPDVQPSDGKKHSALAFIVAEAALDVLSNERSRAEYDAMLKDLQKAAADHEKIEAKRKSTQQEQQTILDDEKLRKATVRLDSAREALSDFYYEHLFAKARENSLETVTPKQLEEWLSSERSEALRKTEQKGRKTAFRIEWEGFVSVQGRRKERGEEIVALVDRLVNDLPSF